MRIRTAVGIVSVLTVIDAAAASAAGVFEDAFAAHAAYTVATPGGPYVAADEVFPGTWTADSGVLTYSRPDTGRDPDYQYSTSLLLTGGSTPATGTTAGLTDFTVRGTLRNIPSDNTAQPGLVVSGSRERGGYVLMVDNGQLNEFVLLAVDGGQILGDEGTPQMVVKKFGKPTQGDSYSIAVTEHRTADAAGHPSFDVSIVSTGPTHPGTLYAGSFTDPDHTSDFGGRQIGYRVRNPLDGNAPAFGPLSLSVPEPASLGLLGMVMTALRRPGPRVTRRTR